MIRRVFAALLSLALLAGCAPQPDPGSQGITFSDDTGAQVTVAKNPKTVAVLTSSLADLWVTAGGQVDITVYETVERKIVSDDVTLVDSGAGKTVNLELLIASKPDLVLYSPDLAGQRQCVDALRDAGIPAAGFAIESFEAYLSALESCTRILDTPERYETYGKAVQARVDQLIALAQAQPETPKLLFVRAGSNAKYTKAKTAENHFVCAMLKELGTENIADKAPILLDGLSIEQILLADPAHIFFTTMGDEAAGENYMQSLIADPVWQTLTAVRTGNVHQLPKDLFQYKPNARWDEAYAHLIRLLYGEIV